MRAEPRVHGHVHLGQPRLPQADRVLLDDGRELADEHTWLATRHSYDLRRDPLTAGLQAQIPLPPVDGLPVLGDDLSWAGSAVHLTSGLAALALGPAARNLAGTRMAARRFTDRPAGAQPE